MRTYIAFSDQSITIRQPARLQAAIKNYDRLTQIFQESPYLKEAEALYIQAQERLDEIGEDVPPPAAPEAMPSDT